jgi:thioredoxin-dependent peroxiredoxin
VRDALPKLKALGVAAIGISPDSPRQQKSFADKFDLDFPLLCDEAHQIAQAYGVWKEKKMYGKTFMGIERSAFLIDAEGKLNQVWYNISPKDTIPELMRAINA